MLAGPPATSHETPVRPTHVFTARALTKAYQVGEVRIEALRPNRRMEGAMLHILVLYGTTDGQTAKIGRFLGDALRAEGVLADVRDARTAAPAPDGYDAVIVAGSVHAGGYQRSVRRWVREHAHVLNEKPTAFVSVCLGVLQREPKVHQELAAILERFFTATGWRATITRNVAGALAYSRYNWVKRWAMVRIVRKAGGDTDTSRDYEYTDWEELRGFARDFLRLVRGGTETAALRHAAMG